MGDKLPFCQVHLPLLILASRNLWRVLKRTPGFSYTCSMPKNTGQKSLPEHDRLCFIFSHLYKEQRGGDSCLFSLHDPLALHILPVCISLRTIFILVMCANWKHQKNSDVLVNTAQPGGSLNLVSLLSIWKLVSWMSGFFNCLDVLNLWIQVLLTSWWTWLMFIVSEGK